jgi:hypothetical protein
MEGIKIIQKLKKIKYLNILFNGAQLFYVD